MKTKITFFSLMLLAVMQVKAQGPYASLGLGYGFSAGAIKFGDNSTQSGSTITHKVVKGSLGGGFHAGAAFGFMFTPNVGAELGFDYLIAGSTVDVPAKTTTTSGSPPVVTTTVNDGDTKFYGGKMLRIIPAIKVVGGDEKASVMPYAKFGMVIGVASSYSIDLSSNNTTTVTYSAPLPPSTSTTTSKSNQTIKYTKGTAWGYAAALGAAFKASDNLSFWGELGLICMSYGAAHSEITKWEDNGTNQLPNKKVRELQTDYSDSYTESTSSSPNDNAPSSGLKDYIPFSSLGINVGVSLSFGGK